MYSRSALLKAAYHFTNEYYIYLDQTDHEYIVDIDKKSGAIAPDIKGRFSNELLAQTTREEIIKQTSHIRQLVLGRAFASTLIEVNPESTIGSAAFELTDNALTIDADKNNIFKDWYENYG